MSDPLPGKGLFGWLGRQVGHIKKAVQADVTAAPAVAYRREKVEEVPHPEDPTMKLRRTTIDEVILDVEKQLPPQASPAHPADPQD